MNYPNYPNLKEGKEEVIKGNGEDIIKGKGEEEIIEGNGKDIIKISKLEPVINQFL